MAAAPAEQLGNVVGMLWRTAARWANLPAVVDRDRGLVVCSGDMVRRAGDGYLYFVGRRDSLMKTLGYRVGPCEVLDVLYASGEIREGLVTSDEDPDRGRAVVACVVHAENGTMDKLRQFCRVEMPGYMHPARIKAVRELPEDPNGKQDLFALRELAAEA